MATAFNDKFVKQKQSQSVLSKGNMSAHSSRSRNTRLSNHVQDYANNKSYGDQPSGVVYDINEPAVEEEKNSRRKSLLSQRSNKGPVSLQPIRKGTPNLDRIEIQRTGLDQNSNPIIRKDDPLNQIQLQDLSDPVEPPAGKQSAQDLKEGSRAKIPECPPGSKPEYYTPEHREGNKYEKDSTKFTSHDWPSNKEYIDIQKLKATASNK